MKKKTLLHFSLALAFCLVASLAKSQTATDAIMMGKKQWCNGLTYMYSSWDKYWEGTLKRENKNLGTVSTQSIMFMSTYGITNKLNAIVSVPYVWTHASAGTLHGLEGFQDIEMDIKYQFYTTRKVFHSLPSADSAPRCRNMKMIFCRCLSDSEVPIFPDDLQSIIIHGIFFATASSAYVWRSDITIDRTSYYTDQIHYTNKVDMPNQLHSNLFVGIRKPNLIVQAQVLNMYTFGGTDIRRNDMPFASNQMNMTSLGGHVKYFFKFLPNLAVVADADFTVAGRNVGQSNMYSGGLYYVVSL